MDEKQKLRALAATHGRSCRKLLEEGAFLDSIYFRAKLAAHYANEYMMRES